MKVSLLFLASCAWSSPPAIQVQTFSTNLNPNALNVNCAVQNIAYTKVIQVIPCEYANATACQTTFPCGFNGMINSTHELWSCSKSGFDNGISSFSVSYSVLGRVYSDGPYSLFLLPSPSASSSTTTVSVTSTKSASTRLAQSTTASALPFPSILPGCQNFNGLDSCQGDQFEYDPSVDSRAWQTPNKAGTNYTAPFGNYGLITGYTDVLYSRDRTSATLTVKIYTRDPQAATECSFGGSLFTSSSTFQATAASTTGSLSITCRLRDQKDATLVLDDFYFYWDKPQINRPETNNGQKGAIVELFGWPYDDIALECEFLGKAGYMGLRVFAPNEHVFSNEWLEPDGNFNPWYFVYQPVSYRLQSRQGNLLQLRNMITKCRGYGVRVFADAVVNHMSGNGNAVNPKRNPQGSNCVYWGPHNSTFGSPYYTHGYTYMLNQETNQRPSLEFPAVPYFPSDFHCERSLSSYTSGFIMQYGWLSGLADLNTGKDRVRARIATYYATLLSVGFSGFRVDAGKHISPDDHAAIFAKLATKMGGSLPEEFVTYLEVLIGGEKDLLCCGYGNYNYYSYFTDVLKSAGLSAVDVAKIKIWSSDYPKEFPVCGTRYIPDERFVIQNDDHDQQNQGSSSRDMQDKGSVLIVQKDVASHRRFEVQLFSRTDGNWQIRQILSSYYFQVGDASGWPDGKSDCSKYSGNTLNIKCKGMPYRKAFVADACGYSMIGPDGSWIIGGYTRVHRDLSIVNAMRRWMGLNSNLSASSLGLASSCA